jgi:hypothetical protein
MLFSLLQRLISSSRHIIVWWQSQWKRKRISSLFYFTLFFFMLYRRRIYFDLFSFVVIFCPLSKFVFCLFALCMRIRFPFIIVVESFSDNASYFLCCLKDIRMVAFASRNICATTRYYIVVRHQIDSVCIDLLDQQWQIMTENIRSNDKQLYSYALILKLT